MLLHDRCGGLDSKVFQSNFLIVDIVLYAYLNETGYKLVDIIRQVNGGTFLTVLYAIFAITFFAETPANISLSF